MLHKLLHYFIYQRPELKHRPRQYINEYDIKAATADEQLLMKAVKARSPEEARRLMAKYKAANVYELLAKLADEKPSLWQRVVTRFVALWMRIEGSTWKHPIERRRRDDSKLEKEYHWEE